MIVRAGGKKRPPALPKEGAMQNFRKRIPVGRGQFTEAAHDFILRQYGKFVNTDGRRRIQSSRTPLLDG
jgi:hypothetical protein